MLCQKSRKYRNIPNVTLINLITGVRDTFHVVVILLTHPNKLCEVAVFCGKNNFMSQFCGKLKRYGNSKLFHLSLHVITSTSKTCFICFIIMLIRVVYIHGSNKQISERKTGLAANNKDALKM
jgi:hypothetical protein